MESLNILHLSDFHIGNFRYENPATLVLKILDILEDRGKKVEVVLVSGDIFDGRSLTPDEDLKKAISFFFLLIQKLIEKNISDETFCENDILFLPGNHDLIREKGNEYKKYDQFIKEFYKNCSNTRLTIIDKYNFICDFPDKKIAILGFNSCRIEIEKVKTDELKWIDKVDLSDFPSEHEKIRVAFKEYKEKDRKWDDYGYIDPIEMDNVFTKLRKQISNYKEYTLAATFHHHFYPFPEIINKYPDASFIRNYAEVIDKFQKYEIKLVMHGHKHLSIQRAITDNKYFENPDSIIYVLSAGSIGSKEVYNPSFQLIKLYDKSNSKIADGEKYDFKDEELSNVKEFSLPPTKKEEKSVSSPLLETLETEDPKLFSEYYKIIDDFETVFQDNDINKIIELVGGMLTIFHDIKLELQKNPKILYVLLLAFNYRVIFLKQKHLLEKSVELSALLERLRASIISSFENLKFANNLIAFISAATNKELDIKFQSIIKNINLTEKRIAAYVSISLFLSDLLLNIRYYGEIYFEKENLKHKINIRLNKDLFYKNIPNDSIYIEGNIDRRAIIISFKCKDPTVHKVAVLIVKDFEMRLNKFEESLKEIKLKLYYIIPKVQPQKYNLENYHFDAYIPTLLPLLTGDNLYKQKEVFIRELVQNSIDATLLRKKLNPDVLINDDINIELGGETRGTTVIKYFKIIDNGTGMSNFTIERYFTSIGRSFYVSEEFDELKKGKEIQYNAISNFGIGFLSSFMVCKEILVKTKNIVEIGESEGLEIEIPNYDGCFFIRNIDFKNIGTEIILYEDKRELFNFRKFEEYMKKTLLGLPLSINIFYKELSKRNFRIDAYEIQSKILALLKENNEIILFVPFSEQLKKSISIPWKEFCNREIGDLEKFGIWMNFSNMSGRSNNYYQTCMNQGLKISDFHIPFDIVARDITPQIIVNYPSSFIQLDVARERILKIKEDIDLTQSLDYLEKQALEFITTRSTNLLNSFPFQINYIIDFFNVRHPENNPELSCEKFTLMLEYNDMKIQASVVKVKNISENYDSKTICYLDITNGESFLKILDFFANIFYASNLDGALENKIFHERPILTDDLEFNNIRIFLERTEFKRFANVFESDYIIELSNRIQAIQGLSENDPVFKKERKKIIDRLNKKEINSFLSEIRKFEKRINETSYDLFENYNNDLLKLKIQLQNNNNLFLYFSFFISQRPRFTMLNLLVSLWIIKFYALNSIKTNEINIAKLNFDTSLLNSNQ